MRDVAEKLALLAPHVMSLWNKNEFAEQQVT
jgi:hypothetical protein